LPNPLRHRDDDFGQRVVKFGCAGVSPHY
jgi:hypothetical protein